MFKKKYIIILLLLIISICTLSAVSAADATDAIATNDDNNTVAIDESSADEVAIDENSDENEKLASSPETSELSVDTSGEILSEAPPSGISGYYVVLNDNYEISAHTEAKIDYYRSPSPSYMPYEAYHYYIRVIDINNNIHYDREVLSNDHTATYVAHTISKSRNTIEPGSYILAFINYADNKVMDTAIIKVRGDATITSTDYNANYNSGAKMTATFKHSVDGKPLSALSVKVVFTKGKTIITKYYIPNSNGQISFVPPVGVGTWNVQFSPAESHIKGSASKTITIKKSKVSVKAKKVYEYKGYKIKLKAIVKSNGKKVKEGKVVFKIRGKKFYAKVKNGVATKKVKLYKIKKYYYSATFLGTKNLYKSKKSVSTAKMYKRHRVKIYAPNPSLYVGQKKYFTIKVRTADGKKVKNGWLKIQSRDGYSKAKVKNGKVKVIAYTNLADVYVKSKGDDSIYKKSVSKKFKIKYIPGSHKYKKATTKYWATTKFKCHCGKTYTHSHTYYDYYGYLHLYKIIVI